MGSFSARCSLALILSMLAISSCEQRRTDFDPPTSKQPMAVNIAGGSSDIDEGGMIVDDGTGPKVIAAPPTQRFSGTGGFALLPKPAALSSNAVAPVVPAKATVLANAAAAGPGSKLSVTLILDDLPADWASFRKFRDQEERESFVAARMAALAPTRQQLVAWLAAHGATQIVPFWIANIIRADVPAELISEVVSRAEVRDIAPADSTKVETGSAWTGSESTDAVRITNYYANNILGHSGGLGHGRVWIAIVEPDPIYREHVTWTKVGGQSRLKTVKLCTNGVCSLTGASTTSNTHGTRMASVAVGSIEGGQDPNLPGTNTTQQRSRSGHLKESYILYYQAPTSPDTVTAVQQAVADGAAVINGSIAMDTTCNSGLNPSGMNQVLQNVLNAGVVPVFCAGNSSHGGGCSMWYPGERPETLAVNGLYTDIGTSYDASGILSDSSRGGVLIQTYGDPNFHTASGVDLVAPGRFTLFAAPPGNSYSNSGFSGCSEATAVTSAVVGGIRNMFNTVGWTPNAGALMATALVFGNGWNADTGGTFTVGTSTLSGAGKLKAHIPNNSDLVSPWGWGWRSVTIHQGETLTWTVGGVWPEPSQITQWKWAALWTPSNMLYVPDVDFYVDDLCGGGGSAYRGDPGYDYRVRFRLSQSEVANRCLQMRAYGYSVPPGGVTIHLMDYFHSGSTADH